MPPPFENLESRGYKSVERVIKLVVDGTGYKIGGFDNNSCDESGNCSESDQKSDCSTYFQNGWDIAQLDDYIGCHVHNLSIDITNFFRNLFIPSRLFLQDYANDFRDFLSQKFGFLYQGLAKFYDFSTNLAGIGVAENCNPTVPNAGFFGNNQPITFDFCKLRNDWGDAWNYSIYFLRGLTAVAFMSAVYYKFNKLIKGGSS